MFPFNTPLFSWAPTLKMLWQILTHCIYYPNHHFQSVNKSFFTSTVPLNSVCSFFYLFHQVTNFSTFFSDSYYSTSVIQYMQKKKKNLFVSSIFSLNESSIFMPKKVNRQRSVSSSATSMIRTCSVTNSKANI